MSDDQKPGSGLLSKVVRFVTKPTMQWSELDKPQAEDNPEEQYSKQMLKEVMERKRRNDFVRKLEFDQLRKIRKSAGKGSGSPTELQTGRGSGMGVEPAPGMAPEAADSQGRSSTLKKINDIEKQMSRQWWSGDAQAAGPATVPVAPAVLPAADVPATVASAPQALPAEPLAAPSALAVDSALDQPERFVHDADLEEAAVLFANGDTAGAEASLLRLVEARQSDRMGQLAVWLTLFDMYRAVGDQTKFDYHAIEFAGKYGRSAPVWFSLPEQLGTSPMQLGAAGDEAAKALNWQAPAALSVASLSGLQANLRRTPPPWTLNWARLTEIRPEAVLPLTTLFRFWAENAEAVVRFAGVGKLVAVLEAATPVGERQVPQDFWSLRLSALRLMGLEHDFEAVALDYCLTYEVSPPSWKDPLVDFASDSSELEAVRYHSTRAARLDFADSDIPGAKGGEGPLAVLEGRIEGDAMHLLQPFDALMQPGKPLTVHCDRLVRIDFVAAGSLLNWVAECEQKQVAVQFSNLHRLNAVFFNLIGINEHSLVMQREN
ncbi:MAG: FimV family protein [Comamonas sp.]